MRLDLPVNLKDETKEKYIGVLVNLSLFLLMSLGIDEFYSVLVRVLEYDVGRQSCCEDGPREMISLSGFTEIYTRRHNAREFERPRTHSLR